MYARAVLRLLSGSSSGKGSFYENCDSHSVKAVLLLVKDAGPDSQVA